MSLITQTIFPSFYDGSVQLPGSKSYWQRALAIASLSDIPSVFLNPLPHSGDVKSMLGIIQQVGTHTVVSHNKLTVVPSSQTFQRLHLDCGESGLAARMFSVISPHFSHEVLITGQGSLLDRPFDMVIDALQKLGLKVKSNEGKLALQLLGSISNTRLYIDASLSSQLLTGLLISLPKIENDSEIFVHNLKSKPYIDMSIELLAKFGVQLSHHNYTQFYIPGKQTPRATSPLEIEADWSSAAFHCVAAAIAGKVELYGLNPSSQQADKKILEALQLCGANFYWNNQQLIVNKNNLKAFDIDLTHAPDLFPALAVLAACCNGPSKLHGVDRLIHKESNRALSIQSEWSKLGIKTEIQNNNLIIYPSKLRSVSVDSHNDHRIAMALSVLSLVSDGPITISNSHCVEKSYPDFFTHFYACCKND
ncbi:MAG TPA: 3-phosphoshikimate 1-carboxyvinyltransferase [Saprospiraceae bacterium]|nr:3-phosphoshikimate 1-carboxyvinyltransferase [Saprospiraceae bacterium]